MRIAWGMRSRPYACDPIFAGGVGLVDAVPGMATFGKWSFLPLIPSGSRATRRESLKALKGKSPALKPRAWEAGLADLPVRVIFEDL